MLSSSTRHWESTLIGTARGAASGESGRRDGLTAGGAARGGVYLSVGGRGRDADLPPTTLRGLAAGKSSGSDKPTIASAPEEPPAVGSDVLPFDPRATLVFPWTDGRAGGVTAPVAARSEAKTAVRGETKPGVRSEAKASASGALHKTAEPGTGKGGAVPPVPVAVAVAAPAAITRRASSDLVQHPERRETRAVVVVPAQSNPSEAQPRRAPEGATHARSTSHEAQESAPGQPRPGFFRNVGRPAEEAEREAADVLAPPKTASWTALWLMVSLAGALGTGAALASVEVTAQAQGVLRAPNGLRTVATSLGGTITEVLVRPGAVVSEGQVLARIEAAELQASLERRARELETVRRDSQEAAKLDTSLQERARIALEEKRQALVARLAVASERLRERQAHDANMAELVEGGGASQRDRLDSREAVQTVVETQSALRAEIAALDLEIADRARQGRDRELSRRGELARAEAAVDEATRLLERIEVRAPAAGRVEALLAQPGQVVAPGALLANVVPDDAPRTVMAFLPVREASFVSVGAEASVEIASLPVSEFGLAQAHVTRVSTDVATTSEMETHLGEAMRGPQVLVELELDASGRGAAMAPHLRSGDRVVARLHRRERRLLGLLFDFVREWTS